MANIRDTLRNEVLKTEQQQALQHEQQSVLDAVSAALVETTSLDERQVAAVRAGLPDTNSEKSPFVKLPPIKAKHLRIGIYLFLGLMGYSASEAVHIKIMEEEQSYSNHNEAKNNLLIAMSRLEWTLTSPYEAYYKKWHSLPTSIDDLDKVRRTNEHLDNSPYFTAYKVVDNIIKLDLSQDYGYNRWIELTPIKVEHLRSTSIKFSCRSNAVDHLLHTNGQYWCEPSRG